MQLEQTDPSLSYKVHFLQESFMILAAILLYINSYDTERDGIDGKTIEIGEQKCLDIF